MKKFGQFLDSMYMKKLEVFLGFWVGIAFVITYINPGNSLIDSWESAMLWSLFITIALFTAYNMGIEKGIKEGIKEGMSEENLKLFMVNSKIQKEFKKLAK